ncbi:unnamed protein product [Urochloa decumbens]|uniref:F-box domain-containing protein n=1 Tax=Urochloa decumbens TaxID=240449 RepID=A0ABC9H8A4_9POAL
MPRSHPLAESIDARRWDAEAPLGRIVLVAHAAFLHVGFVSCAGKPASHRPLPKQVGLTASALPLRYTIPELVVRAARRDAPAAAAAAADAAVLRLCAHGDFLILYGYLASGGRRPRTRWACVDAGLIAAALSGDMAAAARALAGNGNALGARLWNALAEGLARCLFDDICAANAALLPPPRLTSLPADLQAEILGRLAGVDLAMAECTCTGIRDLVAARELWKARYMDERWFLFWFERPEIYGSSRSWKEKYVAMATRWRLRPSRWLRSDLLPLSLLEGLRHAYARGIAQWELDRFKGQDPTEHLIRRFLQRKGKVPVGDGDGGHRRLATAMCGNGQRRCSQEAVYSPSARHGWTHR